MTWNNQQQPLSLTNAIAAGVKPSIRQICISCALAIVAEPEADKELKAVAKALIEHYYPESAAAKKFVVHFAWHKGQLKKEGKLVVKS